MALLSIVALFAVLLAVAGAFFSIRIVPQSRVFVVERFGRFDRVLTPGLNFVIPGLEYVAHVVSILERQLPRSDISIITSDNAQAKVQISVFYRVVEPQLAVYRIENVDAAVATTTAAIIRAACGELAFDDVQSKREFVNSKIKTGLAEATKVWGIEITRTEILDVAVDDVVRKQMQQQLAADRERRAIVLKAEGEQTAVQLAADARLYSAGKEAAAVKVRAEADAYAVRVMGEAIAAYGPAAIGFEIAKRKVAAIESLAASPNAKLLVLPTDVTAALGGLAALLDTAAAAREGEKPGS